MESIISGQTVFVVWRESMEAILIVGILYAYLSKANRRGLKSMWLGVAAGITLSLGLAWSMMFAQNLLHGQAQMIFETTILMMSACLMTQMVYWMRKHGRSLKAELESNLNRSIQTSSFWGIFGIAALSVGREGAEAVVYVYGLSLEHTASSFGMFLSVLSGVGLALLMAWLLSKGLHFLKPHLFFKITGWILLLSAAGLWASAISNLVASNYLPGLVSPLWNTGRWFTPGEILGPILRSVFGYDPSPSLMEVLAYTSFWIFTALLFNKRRASKRAAVAMGAVLVFIVMVCGISQRAQAIEYNELEVYGYQLANPNEFEMEDTTSVSSVDQQKLTNKVIRSSLEASYGVNDRLELAAYLDYWLPVNQHVEYLGFRAHARTRFFEQDEYPVNLGAYLEVELPRNFRQTDVSLEIKPIITRDFSRWTVKVDPDVEFSHTAGTNSVTMDADDGTILSGPTPAKHWVDAWGISSSVSYNLNEHFRPHLDWFATFSSPYASFLMPAADFIILPQLKATAGLGFGLNSNTERRIVVARVEYELYF